MKTTQETIEQKVEALFAPFAGKDTEVLAKAAKYKINPSDKSKYPNLIKHLLGMNGIGNSLSELLGVETPVVFKTIVVTPKLDVKNGMSFENLNFNAVMEKKWKENQMYRTFKNTTFVFCILIAKPDKTVEFHTARVWTMPGQDLKMVQRMWRAIRSEIRTGVTIKPKEVQDGRLFLHNSLPKKTDNAVCHVRPRGSKANPLMELPNGQKIHTQCYWLNASYLKAQLFPETVQ